MNTKHLQKAIIVLFHLLFMTVPFFFTWVNEELFEFPKMLLTYGFTILIVGFWFSRMIVERKIIVKSTPFDWPILLFIVSQTLSTIFSIHPQTSIMGYYTRFHGGLLSTMTYVLLYYALVSNFSKKDIKKLWLTIFIAAFGVSLYAIPEHFGHSASCLLITKKFDVACWVQDVKNRVFATFGQPNWLAAYTITLIPLGISTFILSKKKWQQILFGTTTISLFITLLFTQSRSGFMGFVISGLVFGLGFIWISRQQKTNLWLKKGVILMSLFTIPLAIFGSSFTPTLSDLLTPKDTPLPTVETTPALNRLESGGTDSGEIRKIVWQGAVNIWKRYPLLGSGVETFAYSYYQDRPMNHNLVSEWDFLYNKAHNELLNILANSGSLGLASYILLLGSFVLISIKFTLKKSSNKTADDQLIILALLSGVAALSVSNFFGFSTVVVSTLLFTYLGVVAVLTRTKEEAVDQRHVSLSTPQIIHLTLVGIITLSLLFQVRKVWKADKAFATGKSYIEANYVNQGLGELQTAIDLRPREALYHNQLASTYSKIAISLAQQKQSTAAAEFRQAALDESIVTLRLNPRHLNFHKGRARVLITLSQLDPILLEQAKADLLTAIDLAPTDAKLLYNLGLVELSLDQKEIGIETLEKTIEFKPNYEAARVTLGKQYEELKKLDKALEQYQYIFDHITTDNQEINQRIEKLKIK